MSEAKGLSKGAASWFGRLTAVDSLDFHVQEGTTYGLLGPNGSGKTTLIRLLLGVIPPTSGEAYVLGRRIPNREVCAQIGYMPQAIALYEELSVGENVQFVRQWDDFYNGSGRYAKAQRCA